MLALQRGAVIDGSNEAIKSTSRATCQFLDAVHVTVVFAMNGSASAPTGVLLVTILVLTEPAMVLFANQRVYRLYNGGD